MVDENKCMLDSQGTQAWTQVTSTVTSLIKSEVSWFRRGNLFTGNKIKWSLYIFDNSFMCDVINMNNDERTGYSPVCVARRSNALLNIQHTANVSEPPVLVQSRLNSNIVEKSNRDSEVGIVKCLGSL